MKSMAFIIFFLAEVLLAHSEGVQANSPILFIYDASGSMLTQIDGKTRMQIALGVISNSVYKLPDNQKIGLMVYGHREKEDCEDVEILVGMDNRSKEKIINSLASLKPLGKTPLAYSTSLAIDKLRKSKIQATIILITVGIESCGGNICDVVTAAKNESIEFRLHIIGFGLNKDNTKQLRCAATAGDGNYYDASDAKGLEEILNETFKHTVDKPKNNVTVYTVKNGKAIDALVKAYDLISKRNPISVRTYGDTASFYLPPSNYNFEVTPLEGSNVKTITVSNVQSFEGWTVHQDISFVSEKIAVTTTNNGENWDCIVKVKTLSGNVVASVRTYQQPKDLEVIPGTYNISIQALAMEGIDTYTEIENVTINKGTTPVSYNFKTGKMLLETLADDKSIDCVVMVSEVNSGKKVSAERTYGHEKEFLLNPGKYDVKVVPLSAYKGRESQTITVDVVQGETTNKKVLF
jgi:Ca-activated chloride channel homolog